MGQETEPREGEARFEDRAGPLEAEPLEAELVPVLDAVVARLIPSDENGPGAREAGVVTYIERSLTSDYAEHLVTYRSGLQALDTRAKALHGRAFQALPAELQDALLANLEREAAGSNGQRFFRLVWRHTLEGMFGHPVWGGNRNHVGWRLIGYPGPRLNWEAEDQRLDAEVVPTWEGESRADKS